MSPGALGGLLLDGCFASDGFVAPGLLPGQSAPLTGYALADELFVGEPAAARPADDAGTRDPTPTQSADFAGAARAAPANDEALPGVGTVLGKYRLEELLGSGGFAAVFRATHLLMRTQVAIKLLQPWVLRQRPQLAEQLCEEARFTSLINHANVVRVHDVTMEERHAYIVMEFIDGVSLGRAIARQPLRPLSVLKLGMHICAGLGAGLQQGLVHRDVKPGNILISRDGRAKLVDFGLARHSVLTGGGEEQRATPLGEVAGTPAYMAPEQATDPDHADFRADIYALGATLFHSAVGVPPFTDSDPLRLVYRHIHDPPPVPGELIGGFPPQLSALLLRMLAKQPGERHSSYAELGQALRATYEALKPLRTEDGDSSSGRVAVGDGRRKALMTRVKNMFGNKG
jgi:serine/threonine-protein kinase